MLGTQASSLKTFEIAWLFFSVNPESKAALRRPEVCGYLPEKVVFYHSQRGGILCLFRIIEKKPINEKKLTTVFFDIFDGEPRIYSENAGKTGKIF